MPSFSDYKYKDELGWKNKAKRQVWNFIWFVFARTNPKFGFNSWRLFLLKMFGATIGTGCRVSPNVTVWAPWNLSMGDYSVLGDFVECYSMDKITIGSKVAISQNAYLCTGTHDISRLDRPLITKPIFIEDHAWVCARAIVYPGVTIKEGGVLAAGAIAIKNIPAWTVFGGNPAVKIKNRKIEKKEV